MTSIKRDTLVLPVVLIAALSFSACATHQRSYGSSHRVVYVVEAPPEGAVEVVSVSPGAGYCWIPGHHRWDGRSYVWVGGSWRLAPRGRSAWVSGRWESSPRGWYWVEGSWH